MGTAVPIASWASSKLAPSSSAARHPAFSWATSASSAKILARSTRSCRRAEAASRRERRSCTRFAMLLSCVAPTGGDVGVEEDAFAVTGRAFGVEEDAFGVSGFHLPQASEESLELSSIATVATGSGVDAEAFEEAFGFNGRPCISRKDSPHSRPPSWLQG